MSFVPAPPAKFLRAPPNPCCARHAVEAGALIAKVGDAGGIFFDFIPDPMLTGHVSRVDPLPCLGGNTGERAA